MFKQTIGYPSPNVSAQIIQGLSFLLLSVLSTQFAHSPNAQASERHQSLAQEARDKSVPEALATASGLPAARPELSCAPCDVAIAPGTDAPATRHVHGRALAIKGKTVALNTQEPMRLELGKPVERELSGGQEHSYQLTLTDGQYASVVIEQRGIDVAVQLQERDGKVTTSFDREYRDQGEEKAEIVGVATGSYRLSVRASSKIAPTGRYEIRVAEIRAATKNDRLMHEARQLEADYGRARSAGKYQDALGFAERALAITETVQGTEHPFVAILLYHLAKYYDDKQDFAQSESLHERALAISEKTLGDEHPHTLTIISSLAFLYLQTNEIAKAAPLAERAIEVSQKTLGPEHHFVASRLLTLAQVRQGRQDPKSVEELLLRALMIAEKTLGAEDDLVANVLNQLGIFYSEKGDYSRGETFLLRAKAIREKTNGPENISHVVNLHNLGRIAREKKDYLKAEEYYRKAIAIVDKAFGPENPRLAIILNNIANIYRARGEYPKSLEAHLRVLRISETTRGPYHGLTLLSLGNIAKTYAAQGSIAEAIKFQARADAVIERNIEMNLAIGSERQKMSYLNSMAERTDRTISLNANLVPNDPAASALAALVLLQRKGRVLDATSASFAALRQRSTVEEQALMQQFNETTAQLARLVLNGPQKSSFEEHQKKVTELEESKERLETEISRRSAEFRATSQPVTLAAIQAAIPANVALIEFAVYRPFDPKAESNSEAYKEARYIAYVIRHQSEVRWAELGPAKEIDAAVDALRQALRDPERKDVRQLARAVDKKLMQPVRSLASDVKHWLISPDGKLNLIPFEALVDEQNRYLLERYAFAYLTSGRDLLRLQAPRESKSSPVVFADPVFGDPALIASTDASTNANAANRARFNYSQVFFGPLPGVGDEVRALKTLLPQATFLTREQATEEKLKRVRAPSILHIATHGFFLENDSSADNRTTQKLPGGTRLGKWVAGVDNPLLRSGLALAGANQGRNGDDDGVLTALEATALDLWGTKLVVLSACDTGVGEVKNGDGVYGLRRALFLAGTESQLMSLWPVSDRSTRDLMAGYYQALVQNAGRGEALRRVQLKMLRKKSRSHPYYWASFILAGEWANLKGQR